MSRISVNLKPTAGFCVKSWAQQPAVLNIASKNVSSLPNSLEPQSRSTKIQVPQGMKIFVNIAWDQGVPPPPEGNEDAIERAMRGEDDTDHPNPDAWFVPVVVSEAKQDKDKAGNASLVFDCVFHSSVRARTVRDPLFKTFIQELSLQRIEAQTSLVLSRQISQPNIASKGKLLPRTVLIPSFLSPSTPQKPLIEEITPPAAVADNKPKSDPTRGILKAAAPNTSPATASRPTWRWSKTPGGDAIEIIIAVPTLTHALVAHTTLDLESRRLLLCVPGHPPLDINLGVSDAEIVAAAHGEAPESASAALMLKREGELNVEGAKAEWRVAEGVLVLVC